MEREPGLSQAVVGYYTVRARAVSFDDLLEAARKNMPRYPVPVAHLARLAVDKRFRKRGRGELLLMHALERAGRVSRELCIYAVEVVAKNEAARGFYERSHPLRARGPSAHADNAC